MKTVKIAFLGCGNIGSGVWDVLYESADRLRETAGIEFEISHILASRVRQPDHGPVPTELLCEDISVITNDPEVEFVMEFMGGEHPAADLVLACLKAGKTVITANKLALSLHWDEMMNTAREHGCGVFYEASVCGAVPVIQALQSSFWGNEIQSVEGVFNGTTNFMLTNMEQKGLSYNEALKLAQDAGLAEPDPTYDVDGLDSACKLSILYRLAFRRPCRPQDITTEGIRHLSKTDIECARKLGRRVKLLAHADKDGRPSVGPAFLDATGTLGHVSGANNGLLVDGSACGKMYFSGKGAGRIPTAGALVNDLVRAAMGEAPYFQLNVDQTRTAGSMELKSMPCLRYVRATFPEGSNVPSQLSAQGVHAIVMGTDGNETMLLAECSDPDALRRTLAILGAHIALTAAVPDITTDQVLG